jgi:hypothetical protein
MVNWFIYNTVFPLSPVPLVYFGAWLVGTRKRVMAIIRDGQLCFYCTSLAAVCINDILKAGKLPGNATVSIAGLISCLIISTFTYGIAATTAATAQSPDSSGAPAVGELKLGISSIATAIATTLLVMQLRYTLGLTE